MEEGRDIQKKNSPIVLDDGSEIEQSLGLIYNQMYFRFGSCNIPHYKKRGKGGEDAWFVSEQLMTVADGVGGWEAHGFDSGLFSKQLVADIQTFYEDDRSQDFKDILYSSVAMNHNIGSSTVVMAGFDPARPEVMRTLNLGDSGYIIYRPANFKKPRSLKKVFASSAQQYRFNFPYQCGTAGDSPNDKDYGQDADLEEHLMEDYDVVVMASDGVFDNLYEKDLLKCLVD